MKNVKSIKKIIITFVMIVLIVLVWKSFSLPDVLIAAKRVEWRGRNYGIEGDARWVLGKPIGEDSSGQRLYAIKGDTNRKYHMVVANVDNTEILFVEYGYEIPRDGDVTGIIAEYKVNPNDTRNFTRHNRFFRKKYFEEIIDKTLSIEKFEIFEKKIYIEDNKFYKLYFCFNDCPVAGKYIGYVGEMGGQIYFLLGDDAIVGPSGTDDYKAYIKSFTQYCIIDSENAQKELKYLRSKFKH